MKVFSVSKRCHTNDGRLHSSQSPRKKSDLNGLEIALKSDKFSSLFLKHVMLHQMMIYGIIIRSTLFKKMLFEHYCGDRHKVDNETMDIEEYNKLSVCLFCLFHEKFLSHEDFHVLRFFVQETNTCDRR